MSDLTSWPVVPILQCGLRAAFCCLVTAKMTFQSYAARCPRCSSTSLKLGACCDQASSENQSLPNMQFFWCFCFYGIRIAHQLTRSGGRPCWRNDRAQVRTVWNAQIWRYRRYHPKNTSGTEAPQFAAIVQAETVDSVQKTKHSEQESME